jgi:sugar (pentulose or hexulose) kinase
MQDVEKTKAAISAGETYLGLELGSTRIKAVLIDHQFTPIASGSYTWENKLANNLWTYSLDDIWSGLRGCYAQLVQDVRNHYGVTLTQIGAIGFSGMMHGYMAFDQADHLLVPFRTWRNTTTGKASEKLTRRFRFNIPQRWSIAHLYQAMLNGEAHVSRISYLTTLAGYIHWQLTGQKVVGIGEASGMFPIDSATAQFDARMASQFDVLASEMNYPWTLGAILPRVLTAGESAGFLTAEGAARLDPSGMLQAGIPVCPPEGDAGTGMVATNSVAECTGNISAGTSVFAMVVLEKKLSKVYPEVDLVTTPAGDPVAMVHCNNCSSDIDAWIALFGEFADALGVTLESKNDLLYNLLYSKALEADADGGGLLAYNYCSGEPITGVDEGRPLFMRQPDSRLTLANFMRAHLFTALGALKIGMDILFEGEGVRVSDITGHGGFFKVKDIGQKIMASALGIPVTVMSTAGEGGPWGMAILAAYMQNKQPGETLAAYLKNKVFADVIAVKMASNRYLAVGFEDFMQKYKKGLKAERAAIESF